MGGKSEHISLHITHSSTTPIVPAVHYPGMALSPRVRSKSSFCSPILYALGALLAFVFWVRTRKHPKEIRLPYTCHDAIPAPATPRPLVVVAAGGQRSGSTVLYNALRILMRMRDPNTIAGWHSDLSFILERYSTGEKRNTTLSSSAALRAAGVSVLIKVHSVADWGAFQWGTDAAGTRGKALGAEVDAVFMTYRDVRQVVVSLRRMRWGCKLQLHQIQHPDFCTIPTRCETHLEYDDFLRPKSWVLLAKSLIICRHRLLVAAGNKLVEDIEMAELRALNEARAHKLLTRLSPHLHHEYSHNELRIAARELIGITAPRCAGPLNVHPVTHLHRAHVVVSNDSDESNTEGQEDGIFAIENDPVLSQWLKSNRYLDLVGSLQE